MKRDLPTALQISNRTKKPVFLLFQEVPGCATCSIFGQEILSHPLVVEAIEDLFVPVFIYNNKGGTDREVLDKYREPSWNFPVVRYLRSDGSDLIPRKDRIWKINETVARMIQALEEAGKEVPNYLLVLAQQYPEEELLETAILAMHCYWEGEAKLGSINGVIQTRAGWIANSEVVEILFNKREIGYGELLVHAKKMNCANRVFAKNNEQFKIAKNEFNQSALRLENSMRDAKN